MTTLTAPAPAPVPVRALPPGWSRHLLRGLAVLLAGTVLAMPAVWWTATQEAARAAAAVDALTAEDLARTSERVEAGELPASVLDGAWWEPVVVEPLALTTVLVLALPLGSAALAGFLVAARSRRGRTTALLAATALLVGSVLLRSALAWLPVGLAHTVPPLSWDLAVLLVWHESPYTFVPGAVMAVLLVAGALVARPGPSRDAPHRGAALVCGALVAVVMAAAITLDLFATRTWTWSPGLGFFIVLVGMSSWSGSDAPATPVLAPLGMLAAAVPYLLMGWSGMALVHLAVTAAAVGSVALAGLGTRAARALTRLVT